jgi:dihydroorotate dehydrogenase (fumarate)
LRAFIKARFFKKIKKVNRGYTMDLSTKYLGLNLKNPVVVSASPLSQNVDTVKAIEDFGAAAVVLHSLFEEQITLEDEALDYYLTSGSESYAEAINYFPKNNQFKLGPEEYLNHIAKLKNLQIFLLLQA